MKEADFKILSQQLCSRCLELNWEFNVTSLLKGFWHLHGGIPPCEGVSCRQMGAVRISPSVREMLGIMSLCWFCCPGGPGPLWSPLELPGSRSAWTGQFPTRGYQKLPHRC